VRTALRVPRVWLASVLLLTAAVPNVRADGASVNDRNVSPLMDMEEVVSAPDSEAIGWQSIYSAYS